MRTNRNRGWYGICVSVLVAAGVFSLSFSNSQQTSKDTLVILLQTRSASDPDPRIAGNLADEISGQSLSAQRLARRLAAKGVRGGKDLSPYSHVTAEAVGKDMVEVRVPLDGDSNEARLRKVMEMIGVRGPMRLHLLPSAEPERSSRPASGKATSSVGAGGYWLPVSSGDWTGEGNVLRGVRGGSVLVSSDFIELGYEKLLIKSMSVVGSPSVGYGVELECHDNAIEGVAGRLSDWAGRDVALAFGGTVYACPLRFTVGKGAITLAGWRVSDDAWKMHILLGWQCHSGRVVLPPVSVRRERLGRE